MKKGKPVTADDVRAANWQFMADAGSPKVHIELFSAEIGGVLVKASKTTNKATGAKTAAYMIGTDSAATIDDVVRLVNKRIEG